MAYYTYMMTIFCRLQVARKKKSKKYIPKKALKQRKTHYVAS